MAGEQIYDLRSFIARLEKGGELVRVAAQVDWKYELGAIAHRVFTLKKGPALLFENVKDYKTPVFVGGLLTLRRLAIALEMEPEVSQKEFFTEYVKRLETPVKPVVKTSGPCKENRDFGDAVDVLKFPVPWWNEKDGGRYIGTWHQVVTKDPDTGWVNVGTYRMMIHESSLLGIQFSPYQHIGEMFGKYKKMGKNMPVAIAIGNDPVAMFVSASPFPSGVNEWDMAGALRQRPMELVKCETVDLEVPAYAEIVLEGEISISETRLEGPFGEHTGYYGAGIRPLPVIKIKCVTYRNTPVFRGTPLGKPVTEQNRVSWLAVITQIMEVYRAAGFTAVTGVNAPPEGDPEYSAIIAIKKTYASQGLDAGRLLLSSKVGKIMKHVIVVEDDIDIYDLSQVLWAINMRVQAAKDIYITSNEAASRLDPSQPFASMGFSDKMIIDATWSSTPDYPAREEWDGAIHPQLIETSCRMQEYIDKRWAEYGID